MINLLGPKGGCNLTKLDELAFTIADQGCLAAFGRREQSDLEYSIYETVRQALINAAKAQKRN